MSDSTRRQGARESSGRSLITVELPETDESLAARAVSDPEATEELFRRYVHRIRGYCAHRLADEEAARDAEGVILLKAFESLQRSHVEKFDSWIFSIAHNVVCNIYRDRDLNVELDLVRNLASDSDSVEVAILSTIEQQELRELVSQLKESQREVVELRLAGLSGNEIGEVLGKRRSWVDTTQHRAVHQLRDLLRARREQGVD